MPPALYYMLSTIIASSSCSHYYYQVMDQVLFIVVSRDDSNNVASGNYDEVAVIKVPYRVMNAAVQNHHNYNAKHLLKIPEHTFQ